MHSVSGSSTGALFVPFFMGDFMNKSNLQSMSKKYSNGNLFYGADYRYISEPLCDSRQHIIHTVMV